MGPSPPPPLPTLILPPPAAALPDAAPGSVCRLQARLRTGGAGVTPPLLLSTSLAGPGHPSGSGQGLGSCSASPLVFVPRGVLPQPAHTSSARMSVEAALGFLALLPVRRGPPAELPPPPPVSAGGPPPPVFLTHSPAPRPGPGWVLSLHSPQWGPHVSGVSLPSVCVAGALGLAGVGAAARVPACVPLGF